METIVAVLETLRYACRKQRDVLIKQVDDCPLPINNATLEIGKAVNQRALMLNDLSIVLTDTINELKKAVNDKEPKDLSDEIGELE